MKTKVIAFDVYGTILMSDDPENCVQVREGFVEFANWCLQRGIKLVTSSDNGTSLVKIDLMDSGVPLSLFDDHFRMKKGEVKDFVPILVYYCIHPNELLVFGDRQDLDITPAETRGCQTFLVPPYNSLSDNFDWMTILSLVT